MRDLRALTACGALLVAAGCLVGWYELSPAADLDPDVTVVRPDRVLGIGVAGWLLMVPLLLAPFVPSSRRAVGVALAAIVPGCLVIFLAAGLPNRDAVSGETIGELVAPRTLGQALSVVGAVLLLMALVTAWRRAPDWAVPPRWWAPSAQEP